MTLHRKDNTEEIVGTLNDKDEFSPKRQESRRMWLDDKGALKLLGAPDPSLARSRSGSKVSERPTAAPRC